MSRSKSVMVSKLGAVLRQNATSPMGEQGETMSIIKYLCSAGWDVVYFGRYLGRDELPCWHVEPDINGIDQYMTAKRQEQRFERDIAALNEVFDKVGVPKYAVQTCGYAAPRSVISHYPTGSPQCPSLRYSAPAINACHFFGIERITVNTDASTVSCNREMNLWPDVIPRCVLSQRDRISHKTLGGQKYHIEEVYCGSENWIRDSSDKFSPTSLKPGAGISNVVALAHSWRRKNDYGVRAWQRLLGPGIDIIGDEWSGIDVNGAAKLGSRKPSVLPDILKKYRYGLCVANAKNWYSPKMKEYLVNGIVPLICDFGSGRVDVNCRYVEADSILRIKSYDDIKAMDYSKAAGAAALLLSKLKANFSLLDRSLSGERIGVYRKDL